MRGRASDGDERRHGGHDGEDEGEFEGSGPGGLRPGGDAELVLLTAGAKRDDRLIEVPTTLKPASRQRAAGNLIKHDLVEERPAGWDAPIWRKNDAGRPLALVITDAGLAAIGIEPEPPVARTTPEGGTASPSTPPAASDAAGREAPRAGSKGALVIGLLTQPEGAGIAELQAATGWLPHTTRAALTGLRKRGYAIFREPGPDGSRYRIAEPDPVAPKLARRRKTAAEPASAGA